jgi:hypothetical protein
MADHLVQVDRIGALGKRAEQAAGLDLTSCSGSPIRTSLALACSAWPISRARLAVSTIPASSGVMDLSVDVGDDLVRQIAERAAELVVGRQDEATDGGWLRGADRIAAYIDSPRSRVYALVSARRIPVHHDGAALVARRSDLDAWLIAGSAKRP